MEPVIEPAQVPTLFLIYGGGVIALYLLLALLYVHAYRRRGRARADAARALRHASAIGRHLLAALGRRPVLPRRRRRAAEPRRPRGLHLLPARVRRWRSTARGRDGGGGALRGRGRMSRFLWICLGGAAGTGARYLLSGWALARVRRVLSLRHARGQRHRLVPRRLPHAGRPRDADTVADAAPGADDRRHGRLHDVLDLQLRDDPLRPGRLLGARRGQRVAHAWRPVSSPGFAGIAAGRWLFGG